MDKNSDQQRDRISDRYGIDQPGRALERLLVERLGEEDARAILAAYARAGRTYARAQRVEEARRSLARLEARANPEPWIARRIAALRDLVAHADAYIAGTWSAKQTKQAKKED